MIEEKEFDVISIIIKCDVMKICGDNFEDVNIYISGFKNLTLHIDVDIKLNGGTISGYVQQSVNIEEQINRKISKYVFVKDYEWKVVVDVDINSWLRRNK